MMTDKQVNNFQMMTACFWGVVMMLNKQRLLNEEWKDFVSMKQNFENSSREFLIEEEEDAKRQPVTR